MNLQTGVKETECNKRILEEVEEETGAPAKVIEDAITHYAREIAKTIKSGSMEGVIVPYLGKFQVKLRSQQFKDFRKSLTPEMRKLLEEATPAEREILFTTEEHEETIQSGPELSGGVEQGMDNIDSGVQRTDEEG